MDTAAEFLAGSILYVMGFIVILIGLVVANNIISKYWKPLGWSLFAWMNPPPQRFASQEELDRIAPHLEQDQQNSLTNSKSK